MVNEIDWLVKFMTLFVVFCRLWLSEWMYIFVWSVLLSSKIKIRLEMVKKEEIKLF